LKKGKAHGSKMLRREDRLLHAPNLENQKRGEKGVLGNLTKVERETEISLKHNNCNGKKNTK